MQIRKYSDTIKSVTFRTQYLHVRQDSFMIHGHSVIRRAEPPSFRCLLSWLPQTGGNDRCARSGKTWIHSCLVPVRRLFRPSRSMHFGDVSETNGRETPRQSRSAHVCAFLKSSHVQLKYSINNFAREYPSPKDRH